MRAGSAPHEVDANKQAVANEAANFTRIPLVIAPSRRPLYSVAKASTTLPGMPLPTPIYPDETNTMLPATTGPGAPIEPPLALTPFTVSNDCAISNDHSKLPLLESCARSTPSQAPLNTAPGIAVTAEEMPTWLARLVSSLLCQRTWPSVALNAIKPPLCRP